MRGTCRPHRRRTRSPVRSDAFARWWDYAQQIARSLWTGSPSAPSRCTGPFWMPGRRATCPPKPPTVASRPDTTATPPSASPVIARPAITASALAVQGIVNHRRKAARRAAAAAWRGTRDVPVILTSERLLANTPAGWISFWHDAVTEFYVDLSQWTMALGFGHQCAPVKLTGPCVPGPERLDRTPPLRRAVERRAPACGPAHLSGKAL